MKSDTVLARGSVVHQRGRSPAALWQRFSHSLRELPAKRTRLPGMHIWASREFQQNIPKCYDGVLPPVLPLNVDSLCQHNIVSLFRT